MSKEFLILFAVVTVAYAQQNNGSMAGSYNDLNMRRRQYKANIRDYDLQIETFEELHLERLNTIDVQLDMLMDTLKQSHDKLYPLERLSDFSKKCVKRYRSLLPTFGATKVNVLNCTTEVNSKIRAMVAIPQEIRNNLNGFYENTFERDVENCKMNQSNTDMNKTHTCITNAITNADMYTMGNQEKFALQMVASNLMADVYVNQTLECSFITQSNAVSSTAQANTLIEHCMQGWDDCAKCNGHFCENLAHIPGNMIDMKNETIVNPFFGRNGTVQCLILEVDN